MMDVKTGKIPALLLSLLAIAVLIAAGPGFGLWVALLFALAAWLAVWLIRRDRVRLGRLCWALIALGSLCLASTLIWIGINSVQSQQREMPASGDTVIVLGTGIDDGVPKRMLEKRLDTAIEVAGQFPEAIIIPSGGLDPGQTITEAQAMATYMEAREIAAGRIKQEPRSTSTYENLIYSQPLLEGERIIVVTSGFHTLRAAFWGRRLGWDVETVGAPTPWPERLHWSVRECLALWKDIVKSILV